MSTLVAPDQLPGEPAQSDRRDSRPRVWSSGSMSPDEGTLGAGQEVAGHQQQRPRRYSHSLKHTVSITNFRYKRQYFLVILGVFVFGFVVRLIIGPPETSLPWTPPGTTTGIVPDKTDSNAAAAAPLAAFPAEEPGFPPSPVPPSEVTEEIIQLQPAPLDGQVPKDWGKPIPLGQSRMVGDQEHFWWEYFPLMKGFYEGRRKIVDVSEHVSEQQGGLDKTVAMVEEPEMIELMRLKTTKSQTCYVDQAEKMLPPRLKAYKGLPQGFPAATLGSAYEIGLETNVCYDRINRLAPYGWGFSEDEGGLGLQTQGDIEGLDKIEKLDWRGVKWASAQEWCHEKNQQQNRTAFVLRTWDNFEYTPTHIMMLRAIISELSLSSGAKYEVHFLIEVKDQTLRFWEDKKLNDELLANALPAEFAGMGTLWSMGQMREIYPGPFPESLVNFSGQDLYTAYRSLHWGLQWFATLHQDFKFFWQWEMDIRVTGSYLELLEKVSEWGEKQNKEGVWERSERFLIPSLYNEKNPLTHSSYAMLAKEVDTRLMKEKKDSIKGLQVPVIQLLNPLPEFITTSLADKRDEEVTDLITFNPLFDAKNTTWAFRDDITGYHNPWEPDWRPPRRTALVTASRMSRRLLLTMDKITAEQNRSMFPEMFPASVTIAYGYKGVYVPLPVYIERDWTGSLGLGERGTKGNPRHINEVFNNEKISAEGAAAGMWDRGQGYFHGPGGSVFGPGEHVFRGSNYYAIAPFAGYLWRRWLGRENVHNEVNWEIGTAKGEGTGRMCLPMMVMHPIKSE